MALRDARCLSRRAALGAKAQAPEPRKGAQKFSFQAEVTRLMDIIIHSLYSNKVWGAPAPNQAVPKPTGPAPTSTEYAGCRGRPAGVATLGGRASRERVCCRLPCLARASWRVWWEQVKVL